MISRKVAAGDEAGSSGKDEKIRKHCEQDGGMDGDRWAGHRGALQVFHRTFVLVGALMVVAFLVWFAMRLIFFRVAILAMRLGATLSFHNANLPGAVADVTTIDPKQLRAQHCEYAEEKEQARDYRLGFQSMDRLREVGLYSSGIQVEGTEVVRRGL